MALSSDKLAFAPTFEGEDTDVQQCPHISAALADPLQRQQLTHKFKSAVAWSAQRTHDAIHPAKRRKVSSPICGACGETLTRPFVCLHCSFAGCWRDEHIAEHLKDEGHIFCADLRLGSIFCVECDDFIYEFTLDGLFNSAVLAIEERRTKFQVAKHGREVYQPWSPSPKDMEALEDTVPLPCQGRRGLLNLGQTCFLNVILQCLVHNPLLRNFFLSDKHNSKTCKTKDCTCCEIDKLFAEVYTPSQGPFGPTTILANTWRGTAPLSGYAQQDAHECFIALLNALHATARGSTNVSCNCIVHGTFAGQLQSDIRCARCGSASETVDPCLDVSLELRDGVENTLAGCLKRYTQPEKLTLTGYSCPKCGKGSHEATKRLSIRKLPPVLSFQFKRFEHKAAAQKMSAPVRVPATINMAAYTSLALSGSAANGSAFLNYPGPEALYEYDLFALINHEGQIDNGHYTNFARLQDEWYRFDDEKVIPTTLSTALTFPVPIYMAFYVKRRLDYKAVVVPTYVLTHQTEAERERKGEKESAKEREAREREERARERAEREERERMERDEREREEREREDREREKEVEDELLALS
ncbi:hypothetical protein EVG20_g5463 [Dentipellis fragilis]|uniref:Ubiquitin carboxyl-terminal hydrolase n=1 Tax=Dentipellis fragilis TaxID=205917 RepID=A0A4Y9YVD0_9AGAM|nr:hypothetical protein EVG20_g5463 [Dentipellis fragilis]